MSSQAAVLAAARRPSLARSLARGMARIAPLVALAALVGLWELLVRTLDVKEFVLPPPSAIASEIGAEHRALLDATWVTLGEVLLGFVLSIAVALPLAVAIVYSPFLRNVLYPLVVALQAVPRVAIAPLMVLWFGFGTLPKVLIAFSIAFFPLVVNAVIGLQSVEREILYVVRSMGASPLQVFVKARFPNALPTIFGGLKVAIALSVIGAIVGEFVGAKAGLGYMVDVAQGNLNTRLIFASIVLMAAMGVVLFYAAELVERISVRWYFATRQEAKDDGAAGV